MHRHTEGKWNMIPITSGVYTTKWGDEQLTKMIKDAPPNTIIVAGNSFLSQLVTYSYPMVIGTHVEMAYWSLNMTNGDIKKYLYTQSKIPF
jgi:hypothetical protein